MGAELTDESASRNVVGILRGQLYFSRLPQRVEWQGVGAGTSAETPCYLISNAMSTAA